MELQICPPRTPKPVKSVHRPSPIPVAAADCPLASQEWLRTRFQEVTPEDFSDEALAMCTVLGLEAPAGFSQVWPFIHGPSAVAGSLSTEDLHAIRSVRAVLVLANLHDKSQLQEVKRVMSLLQSIFQGRERQHVILVQHSVQPSSRRTSDADLHFQTLVDLSTHGVHDSIISEKTGFELALAVRTRLLQCEAWRQEWHDHVQANRDMIQTQEAMESMIHDMTWDYLRVRLRTDLPPVDPRIAPGRPSEIDSVQVGACVGRGARGEVYSLTKDGESIGHVLKMIPKRQRPSMQSLHHVRREIAVMKLLSSEAWEHTHIMKIHKIYHSETHLLYRLEDGGSRNLWKRLHLRENNLSPLSSLSSHKAKQICSQMLSAIAHLHSGPHVVHCDIKPENVIISEHPEQIHITIADLDTALIRPPVPCRGLVGTYPLVAPEILLHNICNPYAADVWSMAVLLLEVACRVEILENALGLNWRMQQQINPQLKKLHRQMMAIIHKFFSHPGSTMELLGEHVRPELRDLMPVFAAILPGMLDVTIDRRITSLGALEAFQAVDVMS